MPQSEGWQASTTIRFEADAGASCTFSLLQGFNMSDLAQFAHYTGPPPPPAVGAKAGQKAAARPCARGCSPMAASPAPSIARGSAPCGSRRSPPRDRLHDSRNPPLSFRQVWNMCVGFLGIQFAFALQNADVSRIFQTLGADLREIPILWVAAPLSGLIVQPIIGYASDHTWTRLGRRRPYFLGGALLTTLALVWMPNSSTLWVAAVMLWLMDASINVSMEPFRAFVGDQLPEAQRPLGFALQSFFIGVGAVLASILPWALARIRRSERGACRADSRHGAHCLLGRRRGALLRGAVDGGDHS